MTVDVVRGAEKTSVDSIKIPTAVTHVFSGRLVLSSLQLLVQIFRRSRLIESSWGLFSGVVAGVSYARSLALFAEGTDDLWELLVHTIQLTGHLPANLSRVIAAHHRLQIDCELNCIDILLRKDGIEGKGAVPFFCHTHLLPDI